MKIITIVVLMMLSFSFQFTANANNPAVEKNKITYTWTGTADTNWHNPNNWSDYLVPDATIDVIIPETTNKCWVYAADAECNNLTIYHGTGANFFKLFDEDLHVHGDLTIHGQLILDHPAGRLIVDGDVNWESGSTAFFPNYDEFLVYGDWYFKDGANAQINDGMVSFLGSGGNYIYSEDTNCYFNHLNCFKTSPGWLSFSYASSQDLNIHGNLIIQPNCLLFGSNPNSIILQGDILNYGGLDCNHGTFVFDGDVQFIYQDITYPATTTFNNLTISSTNYTASSYDNITVNGQVTIESGHIASNKTIYVGGNWDNQTGVSGLLPGIGNVEFNGGNYDQYCSNETFNVLVVNKTVGGLLKINGTQVNCAIYDWTSGGIEVEASGSFTANDLIDNGIFGTYVISTGGTVNLTNYNGDVDLNGDIYIGDGTMNVYGGTSPSRWPYVDNASITMSDGILDFHDQGITINDAAPYHLTESITGGTIRIAGSFWGETNEFTPDAGTLELYGNTDASIYLINNCNLHNLLINKISEKDAKNSKVPVLDQRNGKQMGGGTKSDNILMIGTLTIHGSLNITNGVLNSNGFPIYIGGDWTNNVGDAGFIESSASVIFTGGENATIFSNETFYNVIIDKKYLGQMVYVAPGITINTNNLNILYGYLIQENNSQANIAGDLDMFCGYLLLNDNSSVSITGNVNMDNGHIDASQGTNIDITIGGNWTDNNNLGGFHVGGETITVNGSTDQVFYAVFQNLIYFNNLTINKTGGAFRPDAIIALLGNLNINAGDWLDYSPGLNHYISGDFTIESSGNYYPGGTTSFNGAIDAFYQNNGGSGFFRGICISKIFNKTLTLNSDMVVFMDSTTVIEEGTLKLNSNLLKSTGVVRINDGGHLVVDAGASLSLGSHLLVSSGGQLTTIGESLNKALIYNDGSQPYAMDIFGTISANHTTIEDVEYINVQGVGTVDPDNSFNNCSFDGFVFPPSTIWLSINNNQDLTIDNISFPNNPGVSYAYNIGKISDIGHLTVTNASGDFSGPLYEADPGDRIDWIAQEIELNLNVFLEGPFNGIDMNPDLNGNPWLDEGLPLSQPYSMPPWNYEGNEAVAAIPNIDIVDWLLIEFRNAIDAPSAVPETKVAQKAVFLKRDGSIVDLNGSSNPEFYNLPTDHLFLIIQHRNHLGIMSANPITESGGIYSYDFAISADQAYGTNAQKNLVGVIYGMFGGNANTDGDINTNDKIVWTNEAGTQGYKSADFNMNGQIENQDKNDVWVQNIGESSQLPAAPWQCGDDLFDTRDGQSYATIQIGNQCWMAENLNIGTMLNGTTIQTDNGTIEKYCYNNTINNCDSYGGLYQWDEMMQYSTTPGVQGICPPNDGWHLPTNAEWCTLENEVDIGTVSCTAIGWRGTDAGSNLKETGTIHWHHPNIGATNSSGFTALGGGYRKSNGTFGNLTYSAYFWTSTVTSSNTWWYRALFHSYAQVNRYYDSNTLGYSVRCIQDILPIN